MKTYPKYRDSGIQWIGKIPEHWSVKRIKDLSFIFSGATPSSKIYSYWDGDIVWVTPADMTDFGYISNGSSTITESGYSSCGTHIVPSGSIIISSRAPIGKVNITTQEMCTNQGCKSLVLKPNVNGKFIAYYLYNESINIDACGQGTTFKELSLKNLVGYKVIFPPLVEQQRIADYLDEKCGEIDGQVALLEKKRDAYARLKVSVINKAVTHGLNPDVSMRPSGIDWIGDIPAHWERLRLKDVSYMYSGLTGKSGDDFRCDDDTKTKPFVPFTNVLNNTKIDFNQFNRVVMAEGEQQNRVLENDIIFLMSSEDYESIAKSAVVLGDPGEVYLNSFCRGLHFTSNDIFAPFVNYQLNSEKYHDALRFEARGFTRINIKVDRVFSQFITVPPLAEQREIADYLDKKCGEIDAVVENLDKQIDAYKRLKKSLINEVVTGKRAV